MFLDSPFKWTNERKVGLSDLLTQAVISTTLNPTVYLGRDARYLCKFCFYACHGEKSDLFCRRYWAVVLREGFRSIYGPCLPEENSKMSFSATFFIFYGCKFENVFQCNFLNIFWLCQFCVIANVYFKESVKVLLFADVLGFDS